MVQKKEELEHQSISTGQSKIVIKDSFIGIDPGKRGAMARIKCENKTKRITRFEIVRYDKMSLIEILNETRSFIYKEDWLLRKVLIEKVHSMPRDGGKAAFSFGETYGWQCCSVYCEADSNLIDYVRPLDWQTELGCRTGGNKNITRDFAQGIVSKWGITKKDHTFTHHDADAFLIALYCAGKYYGDTFFWRNE